MSEPEAEGEEADLFSVAARWFAKMRAPDAADHREAFDAWLAQDPRNRAEYNRAGEIFSIGKAALREEARGHKRLLLVIASLAALILAGGAAWIISQGSSGREPPGPVAKNEPGSGTASILEANFERRLRLTDASLVTLAPGAAVRLGFTSTTRDLTLVRGFARFEVAHEKRPFVVFAGGGSVTAHGTIFDVALSPAHRVSVKLIEGSVEVRLPGAASLRIPPRRLHPGDALSFQAAGPLGTADPRPAGRELARPDEAAARDYRDVRLGDLLEEANRNAQRKLRLGEPSLAGKLVSGRFRIDDSDVLAERLAALFDLTVDRGRPDEILLRPR